MKKQFITTNTFIYCPDFVSCGMCYSGATVKQSLFQVRLNSDFIFYKTIIMLGHIDVLEVSCSTKLQMFSILNFGLKIRYISDIV